jgi:hypothetical protein
MFYRDSFLLRILAFLVLAGILLAVGSSIYQMGFNQGVTQGLVLGGSEVERPPVAPGYPYYPGYFRPSFGFFPFGFICFGLFFFFVFGWLFRPHRWGRGPWGAHPHRHPHDWGYPPGEQPGDEPGPQSERQPDEPPNRGWS